MKCLKSFNAIQCVDNENNQYAETGVVKYSPDMWNQYDFYMITQLETIFTNAIKIDKKEILNNRNIHVLTYKNLIHNSIIVREYDKRDRYFVYSTTIDIATFIKNQLESKKYAIIQLINKSYYKKEIEHKKCYGWTSVNLDDKQTKKYLLINKLNETHINDVTEMDWKNTVYLLYLPETTEYA